MPSSSPTSEPHAPQINSSRSSSAGSLQDRPAILLLFGFSVLLYIATTGYDFVADDKLLLGRNPYVQSFQYLREIFSGNFWSFLGAGRETSYYCPMVMLLLLVQRVLFGPRPAGFHLVSVLLNALVVVLVYRLGKRLWPRGRAAFWAGLLFAVLPVHTENVAPVSGISDLACAVFFLLAAVVYTRPIGVSGCFPRRTAWMAAGMFLLAALCKEVALVLPALLVFYEHCLRPNDLASPKERFGRYAPMLILAALYLTVRIAVFRGFMNLPAERNLGLKMTITSGFSRLGEYVYKLVWPQHLTYFLRFHPPETWWNASVLFGGLAVLLAAAVFAWSWRRERAVRLAVIWFFLTLGPVLDVR